MGMYDTVLVPCPICKTELEFQSKSGECCLGVYNLDNVPDDVINDINRHSPHTCPTCNTRCKIGVSFKLTIVEV